MTARQPESFVNAARHQALIGIVAAPKYPVADLHFLSYATLIPSGSETSDVTKNAIVTNN
jgi:hypothetical protein